MVGVSPLARFGGTPFQASGAEDTGARCGSSGEEVRLTVSWRPRREPIPADPRLERFRHRVARIWLAQDEVGLLLVLPEVYRTQTGGALWWRRWSEGRHGALLFLSLPQSGLPFTDTFVAPDDLADELDDWDAGCFRFIGETYALQWLGDHDSRRLASEWFGLETPAGPPPPVSPPPRPCQP